MRANRLAHYMDGTEEPSNEQSADANTTAPEDSPDAVAEAKAVEKLKDPEEQRRIEHPDELRLNLKLPSEVATETEVDGKRVVTYEPGTVDRLIYIRTKLRPNDVHRRRILDNLDSYTTIVGAEMKRFMPELGEAGPLATLLAMFSESNWGYLEASLSRPNARMVAREIMAKLSYAADGEPVTIDNIEQGVSGTDLMEYQLFLLKMRLDLEGLIQKKEPARKSGTQPSTPPSRRGSGSRRKKSKS